MTISVLAGGDDRAGGGADRVGSAGRDPGGSKQRPLSFTLKIPGRLRSVKVWEGLYTPMDFRILSRGIKPQPPSVGQEPRDVGIKPNQIGSNRIKLNQT